MKKRININSTEWCDIIFNEKNKAYGAYKLRNTTQSNHLWGFVITISIFGIFITVLSCIINNNNEDSLAWKDIPPCRLGDKEVYIDLPDLPAPPKTMILFCNFVAPDIIPDSLVIKMYSDTKKEEGIINEEGAFTLPDLFPPIEIENDIDISELEEIRSFSCSFPFKEVSDPHPIPEQEAQFPGGSKELHRFISSNIKYPYSAQETETEGFVIAKFTIQKNGSVENIQIVSGLSYTCDKEVLKALRKMPKWIPAKQNGRTVCSSFILPVSYTLKNNNI